MRISDPNESASPKTRSERDSILTLILGIVEDSDLSLKHCPLRLAPVEARPYFSACSTSSSAPERVPVLVCSSRDLYPAEPLPPPHGRYVHGSIHHHDTCCGSRISAGRTGRKWDGSPLWPHKYSENTCNHSQNRNNKATYSLSSKLTVYELSDL